MKIEPIDITQIIVAIIGAAGVIIPALLHRRQIQRRRKRPPEAAPRRITILIIMMCLCSILLIGNLVVFGFRYTPDVEINYPYGGDTVKIREMVRGTSQKIPEGQAIWILVYPHITDRYYPQHNPADVQANGDWTSLTLIGIEEDVGERFDIIVVRADKKAQDIFDVYLAQSKDINEWRGLEKLPEGAVIYDRITVTRG